MKIKKFIAPSMQEALKQIKKEFGDDAVILGNKSVDHPEWRNAVEITAAIDKKEEPQVSVTPGFQAYVPKSVPVTTPTSISSSMVQSQVDVLRKDIEYLRERMDFLINQIKYDHLPHIPKTLQEMLKLLNNNGVKLSVANTIIEDIFTSLKGEELLEEDLIMSKLMSKIKHYLQITGPIKFNEKHPTIVLVMGPTGAGKTTTVAKLAALYKYTYSRKVALISADSFRIAAMDQLKAFSEIAKIPFLPVYSNEDLIEKINSLKKYELILIDTAGLNPRNMKQMVGLKETIKIAKADEIHLVLSITTRYNDLVESLKCFSLISYDGIILTKMDETTGMGDILNLSSDFDRPYSYITFGQDIPEDISLANRNELAQFIVRGKYGN
jgi:flagellar biosynthesis protein FlhF